jgi:hypothetical protein
VQFQYGNFALQLLLKSSLSILFAIGWSASVWAQAPPGPMTGAPSRDTPPPSAQPQLRKAPVQPRTSIFGDWQLNREDSDNPQQKIEDARSSRNSGGYGGGGPRIGYPGGGLGGYGGRRMGQQGESDEERQKMQELMNPANKLTVFEPLISPTGMPISSEAPEALKKISEVDISDDQQRKLALFTDGRKIQKSKDASNQEIAAHWDGKRLVTDEKGPRGKMSRTYELSYDGTQLYETLHMTLGRSDTPLLIRYVYDASGPPPAATGAPAANGAPAPTDSTPKQ